ncbi:hypothetical protein BU15DRAFT_56681, partial [Melanogaster broomeanus]
QGGIRKFANILILTLTVARKDPGKASATLVHISYGGKEIVINSNFELLVGDRAAVRWIPVSGSFSLDKLGGAIPVM